MVAPIDPLEGHRYVDPLNSEGQENYINDVYNITSTRDDYINPMTNEKLSFWSISSSTSDSDEALENC